ncbi:zinc finger CCCH domain-containing protein 17 isoform X2 [Malania oleifera]|uniref:zinc finger CCCH domain-containing protein 17 isoform X2 n=1 Tax=Malania oleifera TaxID=397392 RepID=UPI0025AE8BC3|nr:zinc finger CCCH domain-containing protein 17 isoform X2 [Malania oleifera]
MAADPQNLPQNPHTQQRQQQQQPSALSSAEDDALKSNTDCVYFLASPLTCKKGSECEYRHSEYARVNPRDCWFWLNGNCLNPKCSFRHPPLDGLLGTQAATSVGSSLPTSQPAPSAAVHAPQSASKQAVPCIFFQKGLCLKGDRCAFLHGPNSVNKVLQVPTAASITEPPSPKKAFGGLAKCIQEPKISKANILKSFELPPLVKPAGETETALDKNEVSIHRTLPPAITVDAEPLRYKATTVPPVNNGSSNSRSNRMHRGLVSDDHSKDADDSIRESSPGFDVLVDDELRGSDFYHNEDQFGRTRSHEGRNLNSMNEFDLGRSADYSSMVDVDRERFRDSHGYDSYEFLQGQYAWEQRRASSERKLVGTTHVERRGYPKADSPDQIEESDLRLRLLKQRRVNDLRSGHDYDHDSRIEERSCRGPHRDSHYLPPHESSLSNRLRGRIKLPRRSSPINGNELHSERELDRGRNRSRMSPGRPQTSSHQGRVQDRVKGVVQDFNNEARNFWGPRMKRDILDDKSADFAGPKSLAELKGGKNAESKEQLSSLGRQQNLKVDSHHQSEVDLSFEGPKPLSVILKRKREAEAAVSGSVMLSDNNEENNKKSKEISTGSSKTTSAIETPGVLPPVSGKETGNNRVLGNEGEYKSAVAAVTFEEDNENNEVADGQSSQLQRTNENEVEMEDGMILEETMEDHELEAFDQRDADYDYENVDEGEFDLGGGENPDPDEYFDDEDGDDGDDFAKKIGVMLT